MLYVQTQPLLFLLLSYAVTGLDTPRSLIECDDNGQVTSHVNASGTFYIPGWSENGEGFTNTDPLHSWNITKAVLRDPENLVTKGETFLARPVELHSNSTPSSNYTHRTCIRFSTFPTGGDRGYPNEDGTCASVATSECRQDLRNYFNGKATEFLNRGSLPGPIMFCANFLDTTRSSEYPASCQNFTDTVVKEPPLGFLPYPYENNSTCPEQLISIFWDTGAFDNQWNLGDAVSAAPDNADNFRVYDRAVRSAHNLIIVRFAISTGDEGESKADTQVVCPWASTVEQGSRVPPESLAARNGLGSSLAIAVFVTALAFVM